MKCPLITAGFWADNTTEGQQAINCLKKECAWWLPVDKTCAMVGIHCRLANLVELLDMIKDKMPHEEQFRR